ncbi:MAG TPA: hypothetical protein VGS62_00150 [Streptosporangiaceae bacterium]|nr:hypothetical protein [Streptosporangiaceae bacterium]
MAVTVGDPRPSDRMFGVTPGRQPLRLMCTGGTPGQLDPECSPQDPPHHYELGVVEEDHGVSGRVDKLVGIVGGAIKDPAGGEGHLADSRLILRGAERAQRVPLDQRQAGPRGQLLGQGGFATSGAPSDHNSVHGNQCAAYDAATGIVVLSGGYNGRFFGGTWTWG